MKRTPTASASSTPTPASTGRTSSAASAVPGKSSASSASSARPAPASGAIPSKPPTSKLLPSARNGAAPASARRPISRPATTAVSDSLSTLVDAAVVGDGEQAANTEPIVPDARPKDRLSRTITPVLYLILHNLAVSELCCLCRASRFFFSVAAGTAHDGLWKQRFLKGLAALRARAKAANDPKPVIEPDFLTPKGLSFVGRAFFARKVEEVSTKMPASLPLMNPYRHAILGWTRENRAAKFAKFCAAREKSAQHVAITKRTVEELKLGVQLHLYVGSTALGSVEARGKKTLWQRDVKAHMHDNTIVAAWRTDDRLTVRKLQGVQLIGHSGAVMRELELTDVISAQEREWHVVRNATSEHTVSLLEWRLKDSSKGASTSRAASSSSSSSSSSSFALPDDSATSSDSPFIPNAAARARSAASSRASTAAFTASLHAATGGARKGEGGMAIPGLGCGVIAGVWGPVSPSRGVNDHEVAFLWLALPHSALLSRLPRPQLALKSAPRRWEVRPDDVDSQHGLRATLNLALRSTSRTICSWVFRELLFEIVPPQAAKEHPKEARLDLPNVRELIPPWNKLPGLPWTTSLFSGRFPQLVCLDFTLRTASNLRGEDRPLWVGSAVIDLNEMRPDEEGRGVNLHLDELAAQARRYSARYAQKNVGRIDFELSHTPGVTTSEENGVNGQPPSPRGAGEGVGATRLVALSVHLDLAFVDERFGTRYSSLGAATESHANEQAASRDMTDAQRSEYQRQQLNLRHQADLDRPIVSRHAIAAAGGVPAPAQRTANCPVPSALVLTEQQQRQLAASNRGAQSSRTPAKSSTPRAAAASSSSGSSSAARKTTAAPKSASAASSSSSSSSSASSSSSRTPPVVRRSHEVGGCTISLVEGDIVDVEVECMVNAANTLSFTPMDGGISGALRRACQPADVTGKEKIYWTAEGKEESAVKLPVTQAGVQPAAGGLAERGVKYIIHAVGPTWTDWSISEKTFTIVLPKIKQTVHRALDAAVRMKVRSVALPAISGGIFTHYRADQPQVKEREQRAARKAVLEAVLEWTTKNVGRNPTQGEESEQGARPESSLPDSSASASSSSAPPASSLTSILLCDLPKRQKGGMHMFVEEFAALVPSKEPTPSKARPAAPASSTAAAPAVARPNRPRRPAAAGPRPEWQDPIEKTNEDEEAGFRF